MADFVPSKYQQAIFEFIQNGKGHGLINAVAGSGKTTTIVKALKFITHILRVIFLAFNRSIAVELATRVPANVQASTLNSFGWSICQKNAGQRVNLDKDKTAKILQHRVLNMADKRQKEIYYSVRGPIRRLISLAKANMLYEPTQDQWVALADKFQIDLGDRKNMENVLSLVDQTYAMVKNDTATMDFDDQLFMPVYKNWPVPAHGFIFVDECQDLNPCQVELVLRASKTGRVVCVGDPNQSIYGFRGADSEAVPNLIKALNAKQLFLSVCYRCSLAVIEEAKVLVPRIEAAPGAPKGSVNNALVSEMLKMAKPGDFILCRTTAPLVITCFKFLRAGTKAFVKGRDIGANIIALLEKLAKKAKTQDAIELTEIITHHRDVSVANLMAAEKDDEAIMVQDQCDTLLVFLEDAKTVAEVKVKIESMFTDEENGICLSTVHKAKGLEAERVFILRPELMPHPCAKTPWAIEQENNIKYVAITRAKLDLYWVNEDAQVPGDGAKKTEAPVAPVVPATPATLLSAKNPDFGLTATPFRDKSEPVKQPAAKPKKRGGFVRNTGDIGFRRV